MNIEIVLKELLDPMAVGRDDLPSPNGLPWVAEFEHTAPAKAAKALLERRRLL